MNQKNISHSVSPLWLKASLLGSAWASFEIILGSILHNLHFPLTGTLLSALGMCLLVAGHQFWNDRGILLRAGIICACMKSISPSALILGPMIGIALEAAILEMSVRLLGKNRFGYSIGAGLAVCTPFLQKIVNLIIDFGMNITVLYQKSYEFAAKNLGVHTIGAYDILWIFLVASFFLGAMFALFGMQIGKRVLELPASPSAIAINDSSLSFPEVESSQRFSLQLFLFHAIALPAFLFVQSTLHVIVIASVVTIYVVFALWRYHFMRKRFLSPKLWLWFFGVTVLAGMLLENSTNAHFGFSLHGLLTGITMTLRAVFVVSAFSCISIELRNPKVLDWFLRRGMHNIASSLTIAFAALPTLTSALGSQRAIMHHPSASLARVLRTAVEWLQYYHTQHIQNLPVCIVTGELHSGKTTFVLKLIEQLQQNRVRVGGIVAPGFWNTNERDGFNVIDVQTGKQLPLCRRDAKEFTEVIGPFKFDKEGLTFGAEALSPAKLEQCDLVVIDEVGLLELQGKGWKKSLDEIMSATSLPIIIVVRSSFVQRVCAQWLIHPTHVWNTSHSVEDAVKDVMRVVRKQNRR